MKKITTIILLALIVCTSCKTDIDTVEAGPSIPIVYSILDYRDTVHYVRVNKSFNGNMSAYEMALHPDSILYAKDLDVRVNVISKSGNYIVKTLNFTKTEIKKDSVNSNGEVIFAVDKHHVYVSSGELPASDDYRYELKVSIDGATIASSRINPLSNFRSNVSSGNLISKGKSFGISYNKPKYAGGIIIDVTVSYYERNRDGNYFIKTVQTTSGLKKYQNDSTTGNTTESFKSDLIFELIRKQIGSDSPDIAQRFIGRLTAEFHVANLDFIEQLSSRVAGVNAEVSPISNIIGGYGLFGARTYLKDEEKSLSITTYSNFYENMRDLKFATVNSYRNLPDSLKDIITTK